MCVSRPGKRSRVYKYDHNLWRKERVFCHIDGGGRLICGGGEVKFMCPNQSSMSVCVCVRVCVSYAKEQ